MRFFEGFFFCVADTADLPSMFRRMLPRSWRHSAYRSTAVRGGPGATRKHGMFSSTPPPPTFSKIWKFSRTPTRWRYAQCNDATRAGAFLRFILFFAHGPGRPRQKSPPTSNTRSIASWVQTVFFFCSQFSQNAIVLRLHRARPSLTPSLTYSR